MLQADQANPAVLFGLPLVLSAAPAGQCFKVMHEGEMADVSTQQLLGVVCTSLR